MSSPFLDEVTIQFSAGSGGKGASHFRREKFVPFGGPDGGDGGDGGNIYAVGDSNKLTLFDFRYSPLIKAKDGKAGEGANKTGRSGDDILVPLPLGTEIFKIDSETGESKLIGDLTEHNQKILIAQGGRGGKGNAFFKSATNQSPTHTQPGEPGESFEGRLSLKLIAHVGIIGLPNAGKSTFISRVTSAKPKIADYPFTTLVPNLGVVDFKPGKTFVIADIPGLIPGAHEGKGLGHSFLKHVERTKVLLHLVDVSGWKEEEGSSDKISSPINAFKAINVELTKFSDELDQKKQIVALSKTDQIDNAEKEEKIEKIKKSIEEMGYKVFVISSATGIGIKDVLEEMGKEVFQG